MIFFFQLNDGRRVVAYKSEPVSGERVIDIYGFSAKDGPVRIVEDVIPGHGPDTRVYGVLQEDTRWFERPDKFVLVRLSGEEGTPVLRGAKFFILAEPGVGEEHLVSFLNDLWCEINGEVYDVVVEKFCGKCGCWSEDHDEERETVFFGAEAARKHAEEMYGENKMDVHNA